MLRWKIQSNMHIVCNRSKNGMHN